MKKPFRQGRVCRVSRTAASKMPVTAADTHITTGIMTGHPLAPGNARTVFRGWFSFPEKHPQMRFLSPCNGLPPRFPPACTRERPCPPTAPVRRDPSGCKKARTNLFSTALYALMIRRPRRPGLMVYWLIFLSSCTRGGGLFCPLPLLCAQYNSPMFVLC